MKVHIIYDFREGPYGGGNQFLKALRSEFERIVLYTNDPGDAEAYLFNGYPFADFHLVDHLHNIWRKYPERAYVFRLDGPTFLVRGRNKYYDLLLKRICDTYMDGIVFQSEWSRQRNRDLTGITGCHETVIYNAPDRTIFNTMGRVAFSKDRKVRIIATSWSNNIRKGFDVYQYLDKILDWSRYDMTFVGNTPFEFKHIRWVKPQPSSELAQLLKQHDIYLTASQNDPCSNSLLEALNCGLPALVLNDGGHPELVGDSGLLFDKGDEVPDKLDALVRSYEDFQRALPVHDIREVARKYMDFCIAINKDRRNRRGGTRNSANVPFQFIKLRDYFMFHDLLMKVKRKLQRVR